MLHLFQPFNEKEHMLITIMANVGMFAPYTMSTSLRYPIIEKSF
jgi:hypothetical protein